MKFKILYSDGNGLTDGCSQDQLIRHFPTGGEIPIVLAITHSNYRFNHELNELKGKKWVLVNYVEWGWDFPDNQDNVLGRTSLTPHQADNPEWQTTNLFIRENPPVITFQRELRTRDATDTRVPIDFLVHTPIPQTVSKAEFDSRPFQVSHVWGYSNPIRARIHGEMFGAMANRGINMYDSWEQVDHGPEGNAWASIFTPHYLRKPIERVMELQSRSKISLSLFGCGQKTFRDSEACVGSIPAFIKKKIVHAFPWDESNSIQMSEEWEVAKLIYELGDENLYDKYVAAQENARRYEQTSYFNNWVLPNIQRVL